MADLIAIGPAGAKYQAFALRDGVISGCSHGDTEAAALAGLPFQTDQIIRIGEGKPQTVPCAVLPGGNEVPAVTQDTPPDVLSAWARLWVAGYLASHKNWDGVIWALETDVSHWIHISADEIISFASFLTPRLVAVLNGADTACQTALTNTMSRPERLASHLRQAELGSDSRALTGHLLGAELAAARPYWLGQRIALIAPDGAASGYASALELQGVPVDVCRADAMMADGLMALGSR